jgi:hypothetical protein
MTAADRLRRFVLVIGAIAIASSVTASLRSSSAGSGSTAPRPGGAPVAAAGGSGGIKSPPPTVKTTTPSAPTGAVKAVPASIARDCSVDVAAALGSWIASVPDNSTLSFPAKACYRIDETVVVEGRNRLLLDGNGATLKAVTTGDRNRAQLQLRGGTDLTVRNLIVRGANPHAGATAAAYKPELEAQHAFQVNGATNVLLDHVQAYDTYGDFVYIGPGNHEPSRNVTVANSTFDRSGRQGISITWAVGVTIQANTIADVARSMFDLEANTRKAEVRDIHIVGNVTGAAVNFWFANKGFAATIGSVSIVGNRMDAGTGGLLFVYAKRGDYRGPYLVEGNRFVAGDLIHDEGASAAFFFAFSSDVTIRDNDVGFPNGKQMPAVELRNSHHVRVTGNRFTGAGRTIVASAGSTDVSS